MNINRGTCTLCKLQVLLSVAALINFYNDVLYARSQDAFISPIVMGSPFSFVNEYAAHILGNKTMLHLPQVQAVVVISSYTYQFMHILYILCVCIGNFWITFSLTG